MAAELTVKQAIVWMVRCLPLSRNILREVGAYLRYLFPFVHCDSLYLYDLTSKHTSRHHLTRKFKGSSFLVLENAGRVLCVGHAPPTTAAYSLHMTSLHCTALPSLLTPRCFPGLAQTSTFAYVFGGYGENSCEKQDLRSDQRFSVGEMSESRYRFTPCLFRCLIYLAGLAAGVETFNPVTDTFSQLAVRLPESMQRCYSIAFIKSGVLCVLTDNQQLAFWRVGSDRGFDVSSTKLCLMNPQLPLVMDSQVFVACGSEVFQLSLESFAFVSL